MRRSYLEAAFRHRLLVITPVLITCALGVAFALARPATYVSIASVWADRPVSEESTVGTTGGDTPPSGGQAALMSNYLATRSFLLAVAAKSPIPRIDPSGPPVEVEPALARLAASITTLTPGPNVMTIEVRQASSGAATGVARAVVSEFLDRQRSTLKQRGEAQVQSAQSRLDDRTERLDEAQAELDVHRVDQLKAPPGSLDAQGVELQSRVNRAQAEFLGAQTSLGEAQTQLALTGDESTLFVVDQPTTAAPLGKLRTAAVAAVAGLLAGLSLAVGALVLLVSRDNSVRDERDVEQALGLPVTATVERVDAIVPRRRLGHRQPEEPLVGAGAP